MEYAQLREDRELSPQAVIAYGKWPGEDLKKKLEPLNIKVIRLDCYKPETFDSDVKTLARMVGSEKRAEEFLKWREEKIKVHQRSRVLA